MSEKASVQSARRWRKPKQARSLERVNRILNMARAMFVEKGYTATTTKEIAAQAEVPIGTLYQFFPDKTAILQALAEQYAEQFTQHLESLDTDEKFQLPLEEYVEILIGGTEQFFAQNLGYRAIFLEIQRELPEEDEMADAQLIKASAARLAKRDVSLSAEDCEAIAFVLVKAMGNLLWLSLGQSSQFRQRLGLETRRLAYHYLKSYFPQR